MTAPDASLGGRDTHTIREHLTEICDGYANSHLNPELVVECMRNRASAAIRQMDEADMSDGFLTRIAPGYRLIPDPVACSPGAPRSNT